MLKRHLKSFAARTTTLEGMLVYPEKANQLPQSVRNQAYDDEDQPVSKVFTRYWQMRRYVVMRTHHTVVNYVLGARGWHGGVLRVVR